MLLMYDSFDTYASADLAGRGWLLTNGNVTIAAGGRNATQSLHITASLNTHGVIKALPGSYATVIAGFAVSFSGTVVANWSALNPLFSFRRNGVTQICIYPTSIGNLRVVRGPASGGTTLGETVGLGLSDLTFYYIEIKATFSDTVGVVTLVVDGVTVLSLTSQNTNNGQDSLCDAVMFWNGAASFNSTTDVDDFYCCDTTGSVNKDFLGDVSVLAHRPNGVGNSAAWTRGGVDSGANWSQMDEATMNGDTDYVTATATATKDLYALEDFKAPGKTILAVQSVQQAKKTEPGTASLGTVFRQAGTDYPPGSGLPAGTTYRQLVQIFETNPATGAAWVESDFNAIQAGPYKTA